MKVRGLVLLLAAGVIVGCGGGTTDSTLRTELTGRSFVSESVEGHQLVAGTQVDVSFSSLGTDTQMTVAAQAGCSSFYGPFDLDGSTLRVSTLSAMDPGCGPSDQSQDWLSAFLLAGPILELNDPRLVMHTTDTRIDLLDRKLAIPDRPLVGTQWLGTGFSDGMVITSTPGSPNVTLFNFGSDGGNRHPLQLPDRHGLVHGERRDGDLRRPHVRRYALRGSHLPGGVGSNEVRARWIAGDVHDLGDDAVRDPWQERAGVQRGAVTMRDAIRRGTRRARRAARRS